MPSCPSYPSRLLSHLLSFLGARACARRGLHIDKAKYMAETGKAGGDIVEALCREQAGAAPGGRYGEYLGST